MFTPSVQETEEKTIPSDRQIQQDLAMRSAMLHGYCGNGTSFDTARCCLLFYDWYSQRIRKKLEEFFGEE
ncbi:MAG TPA: hypothetical protein H9761_01200 [Candidatus Eisenbergiella merdavium]|uniref:Uncharacterized protein n=2 Tax=Eisenbergiella TaxID=1432051 RepID=A0A9D2SDH2_9FIRM|nr:hypothetical protein [Candidatus Eisenbergiella merdigallinarum]HJC22305.1 hypothetical protein [Candidatus Eisenbergiella merdavium]